MKEISYNNLCTELNLAAALSNSFFPVQIHATYNAVTGAEDISFHFPGTCLQGKRNALQLKQQYYRGPVADYNYQPEEFGALMKSVSACKNEDALLTMLGDPRRTYHYDPASWRLMESTETPTPLSGVKKGDLIVQTGDRALASALITIGFPLLMLNTGAETLYTLGHQSILKHIVEPAPFLISAFREGTLPSTAPEHDLLHCHSALKHKGDLVREVNKCGRNLLFCAEDVSVAEKDLTGTRVRRRARSASGGGLLVTTTENLAPSLQKKAEKFIL